MGDAIFHRDGDLFVPSEYAGSPWYRGYVHGGPPAGLLARCIEQHVGDPEYQLVRLTVDLFRAVPSVPLRATVETVRGGRRVMGVAASLWADDVEVTRASAQLLRRSDEPGLEPPATVPEGPEGLPVGRGFNRVRPDGTYESPPRGLPGFHNTIEVAWATALNAPHPAAWLRIPMPFIDGEPTSPATAAAALSDFGNAIAGRFTLEGQKSGSYINSDITLYMDRDPVDEWVCLEVPYRQEIRGVGHVESIWYDREGRYGRGVETRLANHNRDT
ncbi:MAG: thioesterase family protein [Dehalococcoidia bacterium]|nr:thioesterase family protein [Dehalococcoidia bacterium]MCA9857149.1 thioesterase family protein [Dehalococcoidia bacterium]MCB9483318.1 thioesterase family protein [Dehalococcoidia bacterium]